MGPQHGFGLAKRILQVSAGVLDLNQGTLYPALLRLEQRGWIKGRWGVSDNNRRAKFYGLTAAGRKQIEREAESWARTVSVMDRFLAPGTGGAVIFGRWLNVVRSRRLDRQLDEELRHHLEALEAEYRVARPVSRRRPARGAARHGWDRAGHGKRIATCAAFRRWKSLWRNIRFGLRSLRRTPAVTGAVLATLAIGIGANTAIFTVVNDVLTQAAAVSRRVAARRGHAPQSAARGGDSVGAVSLFHLSGRKPTRSMASDCGVRPGDRHRARSAGAGAGACRHTRDLADSRDQPLLGREFSARDDTPDSPSTVMLTFGYWQRRFGGDVSVIGRMLTVDGQSLEIIGVLPQRFRFLDRPMDLVYPFQLDQSSVTLGRYVFQSLARLRPGASVSQATADLARIVPLAIARFPAAAGIHPRAVRPPADDPAPAALEGGRRSATAGACCGS